MKFDKSRASLPFRFPIIYDIVIFFFNARREKKILQELVGKNKTVLDVGCGYGRYKDFIDPSCKYYGFDLNEIFVKYAQKRGCDVIVGDVLDPEVYKKSDVVMVIDLLHHLPTKNMTEVIELAVKNCCEKLIIIEPIFYILKNPILDRFLIKFTHAFENDGVSGVHPRYTRDEQIQLFQNTLEKFDALKSLEKFSMKKHIFAVYDLKEK